MSFTALRTTTITATLAMASCMPFSTTGVTSVKLPAEWRHAAGFPSAAPDKDLARWWSSFGDSRMTSLIRTALAGNKDLATAAARVRQAKAQRDGEKASLFPSLGYNSSATRSWTDSDSAGSNQSTAYSAGLNASWEIDFFGKNRNAIFASSADAAAAEENLNSARASLASEVALAYIDLRSLEARLAIVRDSISTREETTQLASWRTQAGQTDQLELAQAKSSLESARSSITSLEQSIAQAKNRIALLCGTTPGGVSTGGGAIPSPVRKLATGIPADTIRQRPDVRSAGYSWVAAVARTKSAEAEALPSLQLSGSLGVDTLRGSKLFNPESAAASLIAGLTGPIFDGGRIRANIRAQSAATDQTLLTYETSVLTALSEVEDALIACRQSATRISLLEKAAASAREASRLATQKYQAGVIDMTTVLDTQRNELSLRESLATTRADHASAHVQLYKALGGGW